MGSQVVYDDKRHLFKDLRVIPTTLFNRQYVGIQWALVEGIQAPEDFEFFVDRSGSPLGPWTEITGPTTANTYIDTRVNRFSKNREIFYRVRARNTVTDVTKATTDADAAPYQSNWEQDLPRGGPENFEEIISGTTPIRFQKSDLIAMEIIRRSNRLLRNFVGVPTAVLKERNFGQRCPSCYDELLSRTTSSFCKSCFGTGFFGGYFPQFDVFVNFDIEPKQSRIEVRGEIEDIDDTAWMSNFPILDPGDLLVRDDGRRWLIISTQSSEIRRVPVSQRLFMRCINPNERNFYEIPVNPPNVPKVGDFKGFAPKGGSGLL